MPFSALFPGWPMQTMAQLAATTMPPRCRQTGIGMITERGRDGVGLWPE